MLRNPHAPQAACSTTHMLRTSHAPPPAYSATRMLRNSRAPHSRFVLAPVGSLLEHVVRYLYDPYPQASTRRLPLWAPFRMYRSFVRYLYAPSRSKDPALRILLPATRCAAGVGFGPPPASQHSRPRLLPLTLCTLCLALARNRATCSSVTRNPQLRALAQMDSLHPASPEYAAAEETVHVSAKRDKLRTKKSRARCCCGARRCTRVGVLMRRGVAGVWRNWVAKLAKPRRDLAQPCATFPVPPPNVLAKNLDVLCWS
eukprot:364306-Chlamydomonas_euryale.AAC.2